MMLKQWLSRLEPVHRAESRQECEAVYRFRYRVYAEEFEPERVWSCIEALPEPGEATELGSFFDTLPRESMRRLVSTGQVVDIAAGTLVTRKGFGERELYVVLDGRFAAIDGDRRLRQMRRGDLFGEIAFLDPAGRRTASVVAEKPGRVLILRGRSVDKLMRRDTVLGSLLTDRLVSLMAERLGGVRGSAVAA